MNKQLALPQHRLVLSAAIGVLVPFLARLPGVAAHGWEWLTDYLPGFGGTMFFSAFNLLPAVALAAVGAASKRAPLAYWIAAAALIAFLLWAHGSVNLHASSTAAIALIFIPVYAVGAVMAGWVLGWVVHAIARNEVARRMFAGIAFCAAVGVPVVVTLNQSSAVAQRESRFPFVAVKGIPLTKRVVYACCSVGLVEVLAHGNFDSRPGDELLVLGASGLAMLEPGTYAVRSSGPFEFQDCAHCVHMYPYALASGTGEVLFATSDGLLDSRGRLLWASKAEGFSRTVPIQRGQDEPTLLLYYNSDRIELRRVDGKVEWSVKLPVENVVAYTDAGGRDWPAAIAGARGSRVLHVYDAAGKETKALPRPAWASSVQSISWPAAGNLLVGSGSWIGILDANGGEVLRHVIQDTSFNPYHGPDGTAVRFKADEPPYLAVASHGSSGYARSVLLIFDASQKLVWQEELNKVSSIIPIPAPSGHGEVLLVGGIDGVVEYSLAP